MYCYCRYISQVLYTDKYDLSDRSRFQELNRDSQERERERERDEKPKRPASVLALKFPVLPTHRTISTDIYNSIVSITWSKQFTTMNVYVD